MSETVIPFPGAKQTEVTPRKIPQIGLDSLARVAEAKRRVKAKRAKREEEKRERENGSMKDSE